MLAHYVRSRSAQQAVCLLYAACALRAYLGLATLALDFRENLDDFRENPSKSSILAIFGEIYDFAENARSLRFARAAHSAALAALAGPRALHCALPRTRYARPRIFAENLDDFRRK